jgi:hypothetical protein
MWDGFMLIKLLFFFHRILFVRDVLSILLNVNQFITEKCCQNIVKDECLIESKPENKIVGLVEVF